MVVFTLCMMYIGEIKLSRWYSARKKRKEGMRKEKEKEREGTKETSREKEEEEETSTTIKTKDDERKEESIEAPAPNNMKRLGSKMRVRTTSHDFLKEESDTLPTYRGRSLLCYVEEEKEKDGNTSANNQGIGHEMGVRRGGERDGFSSLPLRDRPSFESMSRSATDNARSTFL